MPGHYSGDRGMTSGLGKKTWVSMGGPRLPKETSGGGGAGSGKKIKKPGDVDLPFGSGKANTAPKA